MTRTREEADLILARLADRAVRKKQRQLQWRKQLRQWRADDRRKARDEVREIKVQSVACLIEALAEMRPYVGTET